MQLLLDECIDRKLAKEFVSPDAPNDDLVNRLSARSSRLQAILTQSRQSIQTAKGLTADAFWDAVEDHFEKPKS